MAIKKYTMMDYIKDTIPVSLDNINQYEALVEPLVSVTKNQNIETLWLVASGSSYNACVLAKPFMQSCMKNTIKVISPYTFTNYDHYIRKNDCVIVISQSGFSTNAIEAVQMVHTLQHQSIVLTGNINSDIKEYADIVIDYGVKEELVGYVTKGVTTLSLFLMLYAISISGKREYLIDIKKAISMQKEVQDKTISFIDRHYKELTSMHQCYLLGAGATTGVALEGALKIGELIHIPSNYYEIEEYLHGPNFQLTPTYTVIIFDNNDHTSDHTNKIYQATKAVTDRTFIITTSQEYLNDENALLLSETIHPLLVSLTYLPFIQSISFIISRDIHVIKQHPLLQVFNQMVASKTSNYINYDEDI